MSVRPPGRGRSSWSGPSSLKCLVVRVTSARIALPGIALTGIALSRIALSRIALATSRVVAHHFFLLAVRGDGADSAESRDKLERISLVPAAVSR
jgi:hypothetical protein